MSKAGFSAGSILSLVLAVFFFWIFFLSLWFSNNISDRDSFVNKTVSVFESEQVRNAISTELVDKIRERRPIIGAVTAPILSKIIVGILDTDLFDTIYRRMSEELHLQITTRNPRPLTIEVRETAEFIRPLVERQNPELIDNLPERLIIIGENQIPSLYGVGSILPILGPILLIAGIVILLLVWRKSGNKRRYFTILGLVVSASGFLFYFMIPAVGTHLVSNTQNTNTAVVIDSLFKTFTAPLVQLCVAAFIIGLFISLASLVFKKDFLKLPNRK